MKKILKITGIVILAIVLVLIILPFTMKGKIMETVKNEINQSLNAKVDFDRIGFNFFRHFPNATISLNNLVVAGIDEFEGDTLLSAPTLSATVNLKSLWSDSGYEIRQISIDGARVHAHILADGKVNWDIVKETEDSKVETDTTASNFKLLLKQVNISRSDIYFDNDSTQMNLAIQGLNLKLSGDMTADVTNIRSQATIDALSFIMDKIPYLSKAKVNADLNINADLKNQKYTLAENHIQLNEIKAAIEGWVALKDDDSIDMDLKLNAPSTQFKDILSLIPAIYAKDFKDLKTSGEATLAASMQGTMKDELLPAFDVKLNVANAMFQYPGMPQSVTDIQTDIHAYSPGGSADQTIIDIPRFHLVMAGSPFDAQLHVSTPVSDPNLRLSAVGKLDLGKVKDIYPLEDMELNGRLDANLQLATRMSSIEKEQYENVNASGTLKVQEMLIKSKDMQDIQLHNAVLAFSPRYVDLSALSAQIGKNDIAATGKLENFIAYFLKDQTLKGTLSVTSNYLNLNDFMTDDSSSAAADTSALQLIEIPKNLDFNLTGNFKQVIFDNLDLSNVAGQLLVNNGKVTMKNLAMNALGGKLNINGSYDTGKNPQKPEVSLALDIKDVSFVQTFKTFEMVQKMAPIFENMAGNFSTTFNMTSTLGADFMPDLATLAASGLLQSNDVAVSNVKVLDGLASALKNESLKNLKVKDLKLPFTISDGRVNTKPFDVKLGDGTMNLTGSTGLDQTIDYTAKINLAGKLANQYLNNLSVKIGGTFTNPKINVDAKDLANQALGNVAGAILGGDKAASLTEQAGEQIEKQAENLRKQAKSAGDKLIAEAETAGQKLIDEANKTSNPLAKIAAVKAAESGAKKLKDEAQKKADQLNAEAEKQIEALKSKASLK
ncbi:MAG: AsmA family protein [Dysgonamonadaceae bacterium]|nr:AsmA family protein [Dysgonamonadaceae bacterium]